MDDLDASGPWRALDQSATIRAMSHDDLTWLSSIAPEVVEDLRTWTSEEDEDELEEAASSLRRLRHVASFTRELRRALAVALQEIGRSAETADDAEVSFDGLTTFVDLARRDYFIELYERWNRLTVGTVMSPEDHLEAQRIAEALRGTPYQIAGSHGDEPATPEEPAPANVASLAPTPTPLSAAIVLYFRGSDLRAAEAQEEQTGEPPRRKHVRGYVGTLDQSVTVTFRQYLLLRRLESTRTITTNGDSSAEQSALRRLADLFEPWGLRLTSVGLVWSSTPFVVHEYEPGALQAKADRQHEIDATLRDRPGLE